MRGGDILQILLKRIHLAAKALVFDLQVFALLLQHGDSATQLSPFGKKAFTGFAAFTFWHHLQGLSPALPAIALALELLLHLTVALCAYFSLCLHSLQLLLQLDHSLRFFSICLGAEATQATLFRIFLWPPCQGFQLFLLHRRLLLQLLHLLLQLLQACETIHSLGALQDQLEAFSLGLPLLLLPLELILQLGQLFGLGLTLSFQVFAALPLALGSTTEAALLQALLLQLVHTTLLEPPISQILDLDILGSVSLRRPILLIHEDGLAGFQVPQHGTRVQRFPALQDAGGEHGRHHGTR
mmetsp:Transcript_63368/g.100731  ORF Transcript_63368/g.100731 Transcript_63368/m.100731 type:complete len:298 (-) Transcript_63368:44-937(-)